MTKIFAFRFSRLFARRAGAWMGAVFWRALWAVCGMLRPWLAPLGMAALVALVLFSVVFLSGAPLLALLDIFHTRSVWTFAAIAGGATLGLGLIIAGASTVGLWFFRFAPPAVSSIQANSLAKSEAALAQARAFAEAREIECDCAVGAKKKRSQRL